jgi:hypothetical protein
MRLGASRDAKDARELAIVGLHSSLNKWEEAVKEGVVNSVHRPFLACPARNGRRLRKKQGKEDASQGVGKRRGEEK